jgi:hypothetical protein
MKRWLDVSMTVAAGIGAFVVGTMFGLGCPPSQPAATPDASDAAIDAAPPLPPVSVDSAPTPPQPTSVCQPACDRLKLAGCREGTLPDCARVVCNINADPHFKHINLACMQTASTPAAVRACGADCTP